MIHRVLVLACWAAALLALVMASLPHPPELWTRPDDATQHFVAFVVITLLARLAYPRARMLTLLIAIAAFGGLIELVQAIPALGRDCSLDDWMVDIAATAITLVLLEPIQIARERREAQRPSK
ncbi:hypothetical protein ABS767_15030 [Sphingomonas sp. ST-64]|uniref:VanZ like family protein n=1 Tax=Sphingomonas plantiphila TaxID=3163295 RepID=A0ABW8YRQ3_9SPHN